MRPLLPALTALALACAAALPASAESAQSSPFTETEREALHAEIRAYLLENPEILREMITLLEEQQNAATAEGDRNLVTSHLKDIFDDGFSWVGGNPEGDLTLVEFLDYQCGFCRKAQPELAELIDTDGNIRLIVKEMPILGPGSDLAARAAVATLISEGPDSYENLHNRLMTLPGQITDISLDKVLTEAGLEPAAIRTAMADPEVDRRIAATRELAGKLAISGTPTFVFDDRMVRGYLPLAQMQALVDDIRATN
jgi:protein-disulfide isomerase